MSPTYKPERSPSRCSYSRLATPLFLFVCVTTSMCVTTGAAQTDPGVAIELPQRSLCSSTPTSYTVLLDSERSVGGFSLGFTWDPEKVQVLEINPGRDVPDLLFQDTKIEEDGLGPGQAFVAMVATPGSSIGAGVGSEILELEMAWNSSQAGGDAATICLVENFGGLGSPRKSVVSVFEADGRFVSVTPAEVCGSITPLEDTVPPHIHCPNDIVVDCAPDGIEVNYQVGASDNCGDHSVECVPPPGSFFPPGTTEVLVTATDVAGNTSVCSFEVTVGTEACFRRGDTNTDTFVDITDPINLLQSLFLGLGAIDCPDAADVNDDGLLELVDSIILLYHLFLGGDPPAPPGKEHCGVDPNKDELGPCVYDGKCADDDCVDEDGDGECDCVDADLDGICDETGVPHGGGGDDEDGGGGGGDGPHDVGEWDVLECETEGEGCLEHPMVHATLMKNDRLAFCGSGQHDTWEYENELVEHMHFPLYPLDTLFCSGHVNLEDGKVLWVGGTTSHDGAPDGHQHDGETFLHYVGSKTVYTFDPDAIDGWEAAGEMAENRWYPTVTTLNDGKVVATGGWIEANVDAVANNIPEIYDPETGSWKPFANAKKFVSGYPFMFLVPDPIEPRLFYAGRQECGGARTFTLSLTDDPYGKTKEVAWGLEIGTDPNMDFDCEDENIEPVGLAGGSAVMYRPGLIMKAGGPEMCQCADADLDVEDATNRTVVVDVRGVCPQQCPLWREDAKMNFARYDFNLVILPTGDVLAVGGSELGPPHDDNDEKPNAVKAAELWNPPPMQGGDPGTWSEMAQMKYPRKYHSVAVLLPDARVLAAGACRPKLACPPPEIFSPPYLFDENDDPAVQPVIDSVSTLEPEYGEVFQVEVSETTSPIDKVVLIRPASVTHGFDMEQKYVELDFDTTECNNEICSKFVVQAPVHGYLAPPGYYMLFVINQDGVPSKATRIRLPKP